MRHGLVAPAGHATAYVSLDIVQHDEEQYMTKRMTRLVAAAAVALGVAQSGCAMFGGPPTPSPNNPMNTGRVPTARKFAPDQDAEKRAKLPDGSLAAEAAMISVDANEVCFDLVIRTTGERDDMVSPNSWQITLEGTGPSYSTQDFVLRSTHAIEARTYANKGNSLLGLAAQACQLSGKCSEDAANKAIYSGQKFVALTGGGVICYQNQFKPTTNYARLRMEDRRAQSNPFAERTFVWEFR